MANQNRTDFERLEAYLFGSASEADSSTVQDWLNGIAPAPGGHEVEAACREVEARIRSANKNSSKKVWQGWAGYGLAAAVALIVMVAGLHYINPDTLSPIPHSRSYSTRPSQRARITLPNGSIAALAPATRLTIAGNQVTLDGEAVFTVVHRDASPFVVKAGGIDVRVLGTTFGVRKYPGDKNTRVAVAEGRISVNSVVIANGDIAIAANSSNIQKLHDAEQVASVLEVAQGRLAIDARPLGEAVDDLSRWLNLDITATNEVAGRLCSIKLGDEPAAQVLADIAALTNTVYVRTGRKVQFKDR